MANDPKLAADITGSAKQRGDAVKAWFAKEWGSLFGGKDADDLAHAAMPQMDEHHRPLPAHAPAALGEHGRPDNAAPAKTEVHVQVGPNNVSGVGEDDASFRRLMDRITAAVKHALETSSGAGGGAGQSSFVTFGGT
jgi:hypothetical protein